jgi:hypothetical protein
LAIGKNALLYWTKLPPDAGRRRIKLDAMLPAT